MTSSIFVGRKQELESLQALYCKQMPSLVVVKGRRRVGKSRLISEFAARNPQYKFWEFAGLAPYSGMTAQHQRDNFAKQLSIILGSKAPILQDWSDAFEYLSLYLKPGDIILLDEISWMGIKDPSFISKLKLWWDKQKMPVVLVFCGSVSTWIEENILKSTAFFGRINLSINLMPLSIPESARLIKSIGFKGSLYDVYRLLSILGGIPWYLSQINPRLTCEENIKKLCLFQDSLLTTEFDHIFHDLFNVSGTVYKKILDALQDGMKTLAEIRASTAFPHSGTLSAMMEHLITAGFVTKQNLWAFKTNKALKQSLYRICDPYIRFYLRFIEKYKNKIKDGGFKDLVLTQAPGFESHIGLQIEYLLLQNQALLLQSIGVLAADVIAHGPYRQSKTQTQKGCQIDYLVQTVTKNLFICEFKFHRRELGVEIIEEVKQKISALKVPKGFAPIPVLFHISGVSHALGTADYFYRIIDIIDFIEGI